MNDKAKTKPQLIEELRAMRERLAAISAQVKRGAGDGKTKREQVSREQEFQHLFDTLPLGIVYQDQGGEITDANQAAQGILGLPLARMRGRTLMDPRWKTIYEDHSKFAEGDHPSLAALRTGKPVTNVVMGVLHPDERKYRWIQIDAIPQFREGENQPFRVYTTIDDITPRQHTMREFQLNESKFQAIFNNSTHGIGLVNSKGILIQVNEVMARSLGYTPDELCGQSITVTNHPDGVEAAVEMIQRLVRGEVDSYQSEQQLLYY